MPEWRTFRKGPTKWLQFDKPLQITFGRLSRVTDYESLERLEPFPSLLPSQNPPTATSHAAAAESLPRKAKPVADHTSCPVIATTATYVSPPLHDATSRFRPPSPHAPQAAARPGRLQLAAAGRRRTAGRALTDPARARHRSLSIMEPKRWLFLKMVGFRGGGGRALHPPGRPPPRPPAH